MHIKESSKKLTPVSPWVTLNNGLNHNSFKIAHESISASKTVLSYMALKDSKEILEYKRNETLKFFNEEMKKTNSTPPLTFQCDAAITEEEFTTKFSDCRIQ